jgi:hypothetical protein
MSALGRQRPLSSLSREGPLTGAKRKLESLTITILKDRIYRAVSLSKLVARIDRQRVSVRVAKSEIVMPVQHFLGDLIG